MSTRQNRTAVRGENDQCTCLPVEIPTAETDAGKRRTVRGEKNFRKRIPSRGRPPRPLGAFGGFHCERPDCSYHGRLCPHDIHARVDFTVINENVCAVWPWPVITIRSSLDACAYTMRILCTIREGKMKLWKRRTRSDARNLISVRSFTSWKFSPLLCSRYDCN